MTNDNVDILLGDPKKALIKFAIPMLVSMFVLYSYQLIDAMFISGLSTNDIAAIGYLTPLLLVIMGLVVGLTAGSAAIVSRFIGEGDKDKVDNTASIIFIFSTLLAIVISAFMLIFLKPIIILLGSSNVMDYAYAYGWITVVTIIFEVILNVGYGIFNGEGNVKKVTYIMVSTAILNAIGDYILMYICGLGISGAAYSTLLSILVGIVLLSYYFKSSFVNLRFNNLNYNFDTIKKFLLVSIPDSAVFITLSFMVVFINGLLFISGGNLAIATYAAGWKLVIFAFIPLTALSNATLPIVGACYGKKDIKCISLIRDYAIKIELVIAVVISVLMFIFANYLALLFSYNNPDLYNSLVVFNKFMAGFMIFTALGSVSTIVFLGLGKGIHTLILTIIQELLLVVVLGYLFVYVFNLGVNGVWLGIMFGNIFGNIITYSYNIFYIKRFNPS
jgi:putative MATE family efflux protein